MEQTAPAWFPAIAEGDHGRVARWIKAGANPMVTAAVWSPAKDGGIQFATAADVAGALELIIPHLLYCLPPAAKYLAPPECKKMVALFAKATWWSPESHLFFPEQWRRGARYLMWIGRALGMPRDFWLTVVAEMSTNRDWGMPHTWIEDQGWGTTIKGMPCKMCLSEGGFCSLHLYQEESMSSLRKDRMHYLYNSH